MRKGISKGLKRTLGTVLIALALYSVLGFLILPGIALRIANQQLAKYASVPAHIERLELNPFSLEVTAWGLHIGADKTEQIGFERLYANLQVDSLWTGALHLADLQLDKSNTEVLFDKQGQLNLSKLFVLPPSTPEAPQSAPSKPFPIRLDRLQLAGGRLHFQDLRPSEPIEFLYDKLDFELKNLSTVAQDNAQMTLVAAGPNGGRIDWQGNLSLAPIASDGHLQITDLKMKSFWPYVRDSVPLALKDGLLNMSTDYRLNLAKNTELSLSHASVKIAPFALQTPDGRPLVNLQDLEITETAVDLAKKQVHIGKIRSHDLETWAAREADGQLDWQHLFASQPAKAATTKATAEAEHAANDSASQPTSKSPPPAASTPWQIQIADMQLRGYQIHLADRSVTPDVGLDLTPLNVDVENFDSANGKPLTLKLDTGVGKQGKLSIAGQVNLSPLNAKLQVKTSDIDLRIAQTYMTPFVHLELRSGMLTSDLAVDLQNTAPLAFTVTGQAQVDQLHTLDTLKQRDFLKWQALTLEGIDYQQGDHLQIAQISLVQPYARVMINEDRSTNISDLLVKHPDDAAKPKASNSGTSASAAPLGIRIGGVDIKDGSANFADFSLTPNFATAIQKLNGKIGTLDNRQGKSASVDIEGKVEYAPVTIKGALTPFDPLSSLDIATSFKRVELTTLTPYSGKFAGYRIRKGRLNLDLHYRIVKGQLNAENKVVVEQLELGDKVDSPDAVSLPVRLAIALLKDSEGKISIELPVSGDLNNPQFSVMPIIWQTLRNLAVRAVAAPFKFIGGLVGGGAQTDLSNVPFAPGSVDLSSAAQTSLDKLADALRQRPTLRLEVEGASAASSDGPLVAQTHLEHEYQVNWYAVLQRRGDKVPADASQLQVPEAEKPALLEAIYRTALKKQPDPAWTQLSKEARIVKLRQSLLDEWSKSELLLRQLGQARAAAVRVYLIDKNKLGDDRVFLIDANIGKAERDGQVMTVLHLDSE